MKIKQVTLNGFKRFKNLTITGLKESVKLVVLVGPNGSGKSSVFEGFNHWYKLHGYSHIGEADFYLKKGIPTSDNGVWYDNAVSVAFWGATPNQQQIHKAFYFRTAYRNDADFTTSKLMKMGDPSEHIRFDKLISSDASVASNYQRLASITLQGIYSGDYDSNTVKDLREKIIGGVRVSLSHVFDDLQLASLGDPLVNGSLYFSKGSSNSFHYKNLSAGEKSAFDLILDLAVQKQYYPQAIYCIDEPETHMHTSLQAKLMAELYSLISEDGQMWIASHSIGMLKKAREIETANPGTVAFLDFTDLDFDSPTVIKPSAIDSAIWNRFMELAFGDLADLVAPQTIVFCEGNPSAANNKNFDAQIYQRIFDSLDLAPRFVSVGSCNDVENDDSISMKIVRSVLGHSNIIRLVDRDHRSEQEIAEARAKGIRVLSKRHLESYLLDDEVLRALCEAHNQSDAINDVLRIKQQAIQNAVARRRDATDVKAAAGEMISGIRTRLALQNAGNTSSAFLRDTIAPLIKPDMTVYQQLKADIFG